MWITSGGELNDSNQIQEKTIISVSSCWRWHTKNNSWRTSDQSRSCEFHSFKGFNVDPHTPFMVCNICHAQDEKKGDGGGGGTASHHCVIQYLVGLLLCFCVWRLWWTWAVFNRNKSSSANEKVDKTASNDNHHTYLLRLHCYTSVALLS